MPQPTVYVLLPSVKGGGLQKWVTLVADELTRQGWQFVFVSADAKGTVPSFPSQENTPTVFLGCPMVGNGLKAKLKFLNQFSAAFAAFAKTKKPQLVLLAGKEMGLVSLISRFMFGAPLFKTCFLSVSPTTTHLAHMPWPRRMVLKMFYGIIHRQVGSIIAQTEDDATHLQKVFGVKAENLFISPPPLTDDFLKAPLPAKPNRDYREILYVGRFSGEKNLHQLITAFAGLNPTENNIRLRLMGSGPAEALLRNLVAEFDLQNQIDFTPFNADTYSRFAAANVLALTSSFEGFGMVLAEGMAAGTPAVAYDCPFGPRAVINDGQNGFLTPIYNIAALQAALEKALQREWNAEELRASVQKFSVKNVAVEFEKALLHVK